MDLFSTIAGALFNPIGTMVSLISDKVNSKSSEETNKATTPEVSVPQVLPEETSSISGLQLAKAQVSNIDYKGASDTAASLNAELLSIVLEDNNKESAQRRKSILEKGMQAADLKDQQAEKMEDKADKEFISAEIGAVAGVASGIVGTVAGESAGKAVDSLGKGISAPLDRAAKQDEADIKRLEADTQRLTALTTQEQATLDSLGQQAKNIIDTIQETNRSENATMNRILG